ncbi:MAG: TonB-dependent receptor plug domain-containing protein [Candidatus Azobacteroides sp.]|nr:TonB-dependent receptor plug domain-containing protein [Candidatus Azobacteroides sp.]
MKKILLIVLLHSFFLSVLHGQREQSSSLERIGERFETQSAVYPQEKVHLHTDRDYYVPGEKIWFKAYVADAATFRYPTASRYVYAELISPADSLVTEVMIRQEDGLFCGYMQIPQTVPEGDYTLRAYTRYMENPGDDYFFKKNIRIRNLSSVKEKETKDKKTKDIPAKVDFDVSFFPEGGNMVEGVFCKVAFKALNNDGTSANIAGEITNENGTTVASAESFHAGMGAFGFIPESGKKYRLKCRNSNNLEKQFDLPPAHPDALALTVVQLNSDKRIAMEVRKSINTPNVPCYLLVQCRGKALYFSAMNDLNKITVFNKEDFPAGIIHMILFDKQMHPLSERLVFNKNNISEPVVFKTDKAVYKIRDKIVATINTRLIGEEESSLSVAVTDDRDISPDSTTTILSTMLLASELKGYIENPAYYLRDDIRSETALDYLMMTHGWRRYDIPEVVNGNNAIPEIPYQTSFVFTGSVKNLNLFRSRPVAGSEILMMAERDILSATTDENGRFTFRDFEYPDSTRYFIQALTGKGSNRVELVLDRDTFPKPIHVKQSADVENPILKEKAKIELEPNAFISKAEQRSKYDPNMRVIPLKEVTVTARRIERKNESRLQFWANESSDVTIRRKEIEKYKPRLVSDILYHIAGVRVFPNGAISIQQGPLPLVLIDGIPISWDKDLLKSNNDPSLAANSSPVEAVSVHDIESIDIFKGSNASVFGARGIGGAISITTKKGKSINPESWDFNYTVYTPLGYQKPVEFYSPKYETMQAKKSPIPDLRTTIFWKPDIVISNDHKEAVFEFYTSDFPTTYSVVIEGLTTDGRIIRQVEKIQVE